MPVAVVVGDEHAERIRRIRNAAVWIEVATIARVEHAPVGWPIVVIGDPERAMDSRVAHVIRAGVPDDQLQALLTAVATGSALAPAAAPVTPSSPTEARRAQLAFAASRKLAGATDLISTETIAMQAVCELLDVERAQCVFYDPEGGALWSEAKQLAGGDERRAAGGLVGWSARTGLPCSASIAGDDPRFVAAIDDPDGDGTDQILVQPILGADARVHAALVAHRRARSAPLGPNETAMLARFAALVAPLLDQLSSHVEGQQLLGEPEGERLFRKEAVDAFDARTFGDVVRVGPGWFSWSVLVALLIGSIAFLWIGTLATYSTGPAVIRSMARTPITARTPGIVSSVEVAPGDRVAAGAVIARLDDVDQRAAVERLTRELETQLRNHMLDLSDQAADASLRALRQQLEQARNALDERSIIAPVAGAISDLRVRPGQHVEPGDIAASIIDGDAKLEVVALLPGEDRPELARGMSLRLEVAGYRHAYQTLIIESVSSEVIGPNEARRVLGAEVAESMQLRGPVVLVRGRLAGSGFESDGQTFHYHDGMLGTAEVRVREERIIYAIVPGLR